MNPPPEKVDLLPFPVEHDFYSPKGFWFEVFDPQVPVDNKPQRWKLT